MSNRVTSPAMHAHSYPWHNVDRSSYPDMNYLLSEGAKARYVLAAHYVRHQAHIVEIGGFKTPITAFLTRTPNSVLVVDPLIAEYRGEELGGAPCRVEHVASTFQDYVFDLEPGSYGLVLLGASMKHFSSDSTQRQVETRKLVSLVENSAVAVLEFALEWSLGKDNITTILDSTRAEIIMQADLDLGQSPGMDTIHHRRRFVVLEPAGTIHTNG